VSGVLDRRTLLRLGALGVLGPGLLGADAPSRPLPPRTVPRFAVDLPVPPVLTPRSAPGVDRYVLTQRATMQQVLPPPLPATPIWGYDGRFPGPTIRARRGRPVHVRQRNALPQPVTVHLHGSASRPVDDGQPGLPIAPGAERTYHYDNEQRGATLWYHDHSDMRTSLHVNRGLAGVYVLHDPQEDRLGLPGGAYDIPLVLQDRLFDTDGRMLHHVHGGTDLLGDVALVNGAAWPRMAVEARRYRFRVVVASSSRPYVLGLSGRPFTVVGSDGGLLPRPVRTTSLLAVTGERYDVVVDFSDVPVGRSVALQNLAAPGRMGSLLRFDVVRRRSRDDSRVPAELAEIRPLVAPGAAVDRVWRFSRAADGTFVINGRPFDPDRVDARPRLGSTEVWEFRTQGVGAFHPVHPHLVSFQLLSRDGAPPGAHERGWKDTVFVGEGSVVRVAARFRPYAGRYLLHCHNLVHEDHAMMAQFEVVT
jgi:FtsP/CotA-like multicopper oxidase with cupredoxin domain